MKSAAGGFSRISPARMPGRPRYMVFRALRLPAEHLQRSSSTASCMRSAHAFTASATGTVLTMISWNISSTPLPAGQGAGEVGAKLVPMEKPPCSMPSAWAQAALSASAFSNTGSFQKAPSSAAVAFNVGVRRTGSAGQEVDVIVLLEHEPDEVLRGLNVLAVAHANREGSDVVGRRQRTASIFSAISGAESSALLMVKALSSVISVAPVLSSVN